MPCPDLSNYFHCARSTPKARDIIMFSLTAATGIRIPPNFGPADLAS